MRVKRRADREREREKEKDVKRACGIIKIDLSTSIDREEST